MIKEAVGTADTIDEAKQKALDELNVAYDADIQVEVISLPKKKTLGIFGGSQATVKVSVEVPDEKPARKPKSVKKEKIVKKHEEKTAKKATDKPVEKAADKVYVNADDVPADSPAGKGIAYLKRILSDIGCNDISIAVSDIDGGSEITLTGEGLGVIIGRRGETLDALQYLISLAANAGVSGYYRIVLNTGDYRQKREQALTALAKRMADQAIKSGKCRTLEPMNPYERRIIHTVIQEIPGVTSTSFGEGSGRRVVIAPEGKEPRPRPDYKSRGRRFDRSSRGSRGYAKKEAYEPHTDPDKAPVKDASEMPLYGRIDK